MHFRDRVLTRFAAQLGHPRGLPGRLLGRMLNRANRAAITAAVEALEIPSGAVVADLGFGGGIGLKLILRRLDETGQVHGVDQSTAMLKAAARRFRDEVRTGRLALHQAPIERLPLASASLDGAITLNTIYFITDLAAALSECARVLKPGGQLVIGLDDPDTMAGQPLFAQGFHVRSLAEVANALRLAGLAVDQHRRVGSGEHVFHLLITKARSGPPIRER